MIKLNTLKNNIAAIFALAFALAFGLSASAEEMGSGQWSTEGLCSGSGAKWKQLHVVAEHFSNGRFHVSGEMDGRLLERDIAAKQGDSMVSEQGVALLAGWARSAMLGDSSRMDAFEAEMFSQYGVSKLKMSPVSQEVSFSLGEGASVAKCVFKPHWDEGALKSGVVSPLSKLPK